MPRKGMNWAQGIWVKFEGLKAAVGTAEMLPDTAAAMVQLEAALTAEVPRKSGRYGSNRSKKARLGPTQRRQMQLMTQKVRRAVQGKKKAITDLRNHVKSKFGGVVTLECLVNVCLAAPIVSSRALVRAFRDVKGLDSDFLSRSTMTMIRDAWIG